MPNFFGFFQPGRVGGRFSLPHYYWYPKIVQHSVKTYLVLIFISASRVPSMNTGLLYTYLRKTVLQSCMYVLGIIMAIRVVVFSSRGGVQNWKDFCLRIKTLKGNCWILRIGLTERCQIVPKFDFQSQFSMPKVVRIFLNFFFFVEEYQFKSIFLVIDIFW